MSFSPVSGSLACLPSRLPFSFSPPFCGRALGMDDFWLTRHGHADHLANDHVAHHLEVVVRTVEVAFDKEEVASTVHADAFRGVQPGRGGRAAVPAVANLAA